MAWQEISAASHLSVAHLLSNICTKICWNWTTRVLLKLSLIVGWYTFLGHSVVLLTSYWGASNSKSDLRQSLWSWWFGVAVVSFVAWTKLLYIEPG